MRITIVQGPFLPIPPLQGGAIEKFFYPLAQLWAAAGHTVTHISCAYPALPTQDTTHGVHYIRVPSHRATSSPLYNKTLDLTYALRCRRVLPPADILITHTFFLPLLVGRHSPYGRLYVHAGRFPQGQLRFYGHAARIQFPSTAVQAAALVQAPHLAHLFSVIPYALPDIPVTITPKTAHTPLRLLYTGRLHPEKGIHTLLQALALLPPATQACFTLRIVGPHLATQGGGGPQYLSQLQTLAHTLHTPVEFLGPTFDPPTLATHYQWADLFVYPSMASRGETFGVAPLEAMAHGTPCLLSALPCFADFATPANSFTFDHTQPTQAHHRCAQALQNAQSAADRWPTLSVAAHHTVAHSFQLPTIATHFIQDFQKII